MDYLHLAKACPQCGEVISGWHKRLWSKDRTKVSEHFVEAHFDKATWGPFACTACGAKLVLICADPRLVHKMAGAVFAGFIAGFILPAFIGLAACFLCGLVLAGLLMALFVSLIIARSIAVEVGKTDSPFINESTN